MNLDRWGRVTCEDYRKAKKCLSPPTHFTTKYYSCQKGWAGVNIFKPVSYGAIDRTVIPVFD